MADNPETVGTEYFGDVEIECEPGVLIPRWETAESVSCLAERLFPENGKPTLPRELRVLDLCTGTGCIPLHFHHAFNEGLRRAGVEGDSVDLRLLGVDISKKAVNLARRNQRRLEHEYTGSTQFELSALQCLQFIQADVLKDDSGPTDTNIQALVDVLKSYAKESGEALGWDVLISNPPYISPSSFNTSTSRSVRVFEPKLALVPPDVPGSTDLNAGDVFYPRLLAIAEEVSAKIVLFEVADLEQADRVANIANSTGLWGGIQIWRDVPAETPVELTRSGFKVLGHGNGRSVFCWRGEAAEWLGLEREESDRAQSLM